MPIPKIKRNLPTFVIGFLTMCIFWYIRNQNHIETLQGEHQTVFIVIGIISMIAFVGFFGWLFTALRKNILPKNTILQVLSFGIIAWTGYFVVFGVTVLLNSIYYAHLYDPGISTFLTLDTGIPTYFNLKELLETEVTNILMFIVLGVSISVTRRLVKKRK